MKNYSIGGSEIDAQFTSSCQNGQITKGPSGYQTISMEQVDQTQ